MTVIATGFSREETRAAVQVGAADRSAPAPAPVGVRDREPAEDPGVPEQQRFFRRELGLDFDASDEGFTPHFNSKMKDDLDVPAFLRKQAD